MRCHFIKFLENANEISFKIYCLWYVFWGEMNLTPCKCFNMEFFTNYGVCVQNVNSNFE